MITAVALILFAALSHKKPLWGLGSLVAASPLYLVRFNILGLPTTFLEMMIVVFLFSVAITAHKNIPTLKRLGKFNWLIAAFVLSGIIATLFSPELTKAAGQLKAYIIEPVLLFYAACLIIRREEESKAILYGAAWSVTMVSIFGLIQKATRIGLPLRFWGTGEEPLRIVSLFEYPNALALYLAPLLALLIAISFRRPVLINKYILYLSIFLGGINIIMTFSRGAWLGIIAAVIFISSRYLPMKKVLIAGLLAIALFAMIPQTRDRAFDVLSDSSTEAHIDLLRAGSAKVLASPFVGNGLYGFRTTLQEAGYQGEILNYPHNIFLNFWLELGLLGIVSFAGIYVYFFHYYAARKFGIPVVAFMITILIHGLFDVPYFKNDLSIWFWSIASLFFIEKSG